MAIRKLSKTEYLLLMTAEQIARAQEMASERQMHVP
ncbi:MAG: hypothetical protein QOE39_1445 [Bradyrhizobium sp.]|jgi:hypothetical protein|nr:hypothetical protein [Bradyrhizobium sp.]